MEEEKECGEGRKNYTLRRGRGGGGGVSGRINWEGVYQGGRNWVVGLRMRAGKDGCDFLSKKWMARVESC